MKVFQLSGYQRDLVNMYAIHQDTPGLVAWIENLVNSQLQEATSGKTDDGTTAQPAKE